MPSFAWYRLLQPRRHIPKRGQRGFQVIDDLLLQHVRRRQIVEIVQTLVLQPEQIQAGLVAEPNIAIPLPTPGEEVVADYALIGLTLGRHPLSLVRKQLAARRCLSSADLAKLPHGRRVRFAGLVRMRQRPETASGVTFVTLEDEHGMVNAVVWQRTAEEQRRELLESSLMAIDGRLERADGVQHLIVSRMENYGGLLAKLQTGSRDFR